EYGLKGIASGIAEFPRVANRRLEGIGGPGSEEHAAQRQRPAACIPAPGFGAAVGKRRNEMQEVGIIDASIQDRHDAYDDQGHDHQESYELLNVCCTADTAMLERKSDQHERGSDEECGIKRERHGAYGLSEQGPFSEIMYWRDSRQYVSRGNTAAEREYGRPRDPIAPNRKRGDHLAVAHPGGRAVYRCAAGFVGK